MKHDDQTTYTPRYPLPDPADLPLTQAATSMALCVSTDRNRLGPEMMMRELRAALAEFGPGGNFRTPDIRLSAQMAVLDSMFHIGVQNAVRIRKICVQQPTFENGLTAKYEDGDLYLDPDTTQLTLKVQNQYRRTVEGMKTGHTERRRVSIARRRVRLQEREAGK